jgi:CheY-like chemotaxis protein
MRTLAKQPRPGPNLPAILQVDDNPDDLLFFQLAWEKAGVANPIRFAASQKEAVEYLEGRGKFEDRGAFPVPSVIVMDMRLPDGKATDFLRWIRGHPGFKKLVMIVWSGSAHEEEIAEAYRSGANSFLFKTSSPNQLQDTVNLICYYWLNQNLSAGEPLPAVWPTNQARA